VRSLKAIMSLSFSFALFLALVVGFQNCAEGLPEEEDDSSVQEISTNARLVEYRETDLDLTHRTLTVLGYAMHDETGYEYYTYPIKITVYFTQTEEVLCESEEELYADSYSMVYPNHGIESQCTMVKKTGSHTVILEGIPVDKVDYEELDRMEIIL
jgi:hypothetical protein